jgi:hypothetical protein
MAVVLGVLEDAVVISIFVAVMMLTVEYINVWSSGAFARMLQGSRFRQYLLAALLGATPGCLGVFVLVTLHVQRGITIGALVAGMLAATGDELFVMLAMFPRTALPLVAGLVVLGVLAGWATDAVIARVTPRECAECCEFAEDHAAECDCLPESGVLALWRHPRLERVAVVIAGAAFVVALATGWIGPRDWDWERVGFLVVGCLGLLIVATSSERFFREHLWTHVIREHLPRLFLWTLGALAVVTAVESSVEVGTLIAENRWLVLVLAAAVGVIPESGPHLVFVTLFAGGSLPLSALVANSVVQDGHGMIPLLAHSRRDFLVVKAVNLVIGLAVGAAMMSGGW